jgi:ubiquitin carboxyl-terminal hydrolase 16/45
MLSVCRVCSAGKVYNPRPVFNAVCKRAPQFKSMQQQDSHELLRYLLDGLQMEERDALKKLAASSDGESTKSESTVASEKTPPLPLPPTWIEKTFGGELQWSTTCRECHHVSVVKEPFQDISLPVPVASQEEAANGKKGGDKCEDEGSAAGSSKPQGWMSAKDKKR